MAVESAYDYRIGDEVSRSSSKHAIFVKMRKYYQLILILVSFLSLTALIFYRHEYHRLRYVLEVLNFFGDPGQKSKEDEGRSCSNSHRKFNSGVGAYASWQRISNSLHVYSAFWDSDLEQVKAIAVNFENESLDSIECSLWFADKGEPYKGNAEIQPQNQGGSGFKYLHCRAVDVHPGVPRSVAFSLKGGVSPLAHIPILHNTVSRSMQNTSVFMCTIPGFITNSEAVGFFAYHQLIGVTAFIVYGQPQFQGLNIINAPWNFPFAGAMYVEPVIAADCSLRAFAAGATYVFTLSWNQYIVPRYHRTLQSLFNDYTESGKTVNFEIPVVDFCTEISDVKGTISKYEMLPMQKTHRRTDSTSKFITVHALSKSTQKIPNDFVAIHQYAHCFKSKRNRKGRVIHDPVFRRFDPDLHEALKYWTAVD